MPQTDLEIPRYERVSDIAETNGVLSGEPRLADNFARWRKGSIHDDAKAAELGFARGPVSGLIHNEQFPRLALHAFGPEWFERGGYSFYYRHPAYDGDVVQAFMRVPDAITDTQVEAWSELSDGTRVAEGTVSMGDPPAPSALRQRLARQPHGGEVRILARARPGVELPEVTRRFSAADQRARRTTMTEPLDWYFGPSPWGGPIASSLAFYRLMRAPLEQHAEPGVQIDGAIEVRVLRGPVFVDRDYLLTSRILSVGATPRTEYLWFESELRDPAHGREIVATKLMMCRWMKSGPLYGGV
jgi:hypothetical protein